MHAQSNWRAEQSSRGDIFVNHSISSHVVRAEAIPYRSKIRAFHESLPGYQPTTLHRLTNIAHDLQLSACLVKDESFRLGLPAFKILGASWGVYRSLCQHFKRVPDPSITTITSLRSEVEAQRRSGRSIVLYAATDGNHGRAVARMARLMVLSEFARDKVAREEQLSDLEIGAMIYVPKDLYETTRQLIRSEGAQVIEVDGDYDDAVRACWNASVSRDGGTAIMVQDNAFEYLEAGESKLYRDIPEWIVEGYETLVHEVDEQSRIIPTHVITPIGVGSLGHAVVMWAKTKDPPVRVIAVEPERAGCLHASLRTGVSTVVKAEATIMSGMCCGTVSPISYDTLKHGIDASVLLTESEAHQAVLDLQQQGIEAGPCGAATLAGLQKVMRDVKARVELQMDETSVVLMLSTEGKREYPVPELV